MKYCHQRFFSLFYYFGIVCFLVRIFAEALHYILVLGNILAWLTLRMLSVLSLRLLSMVTVYYRVFHFQFINSRAKARKMVLLKHAIKYVKKKT